MIIINSKRLLEWQSKRVVKFPSLKSDPQGRAASSRRCRLQEASQGSSRLQFSVSCHCAVTRAVLSASNGETKRIRISAPFALQLKAVESTLGSIRQQVTASREDVEAHDDRACAAFGA
jgi:hypothetical protein